MPTLNHKQTVFARVEKEFKDAQDTMAKIKATHPRVEASVKRHEEKVLNSIRLLEEMPKCYSQESDKMKGLRKILKSHISDAAYITEYANAARIVENFAATLDMPLYTAREAQHEIKGLGSDQFDIVSPAGISEDDRIYGIIFK